MNSKEIESESDEDYSEYVLSDHKRRNLLSGVSITEDKDSTTLSEFGERLAETRNATKQNRAWITAIIPPWKETPEREDSPEGILTDSIKPDIKDHKDDKIAVELMLRNGYTFWTFFDYPEKRFPDDHPFNLMLNHIGYNIDTITNAIGEPIEVEYDDEKEEWDISEEIFNQKTPFETKKERLSEKIPRVFKHDSIQLGIMATTTILVYILLLYILFSIISPLQLTLIDILQTTGGSLILLTATILLLSKLTTIYREYTTSNTQQNNKSPARYGG